MPLSKSAIKNAIRATLDSNMDQTDPETSRNALADRLADEICNAAKAAIENATYTSGLFAPNGPVTGTISLTVAIVE